MVMGGGEDFECALGMVVKFFWCLKGLICKLRMMLYTLGCRII